ncbi:uncharacterized protein LOC110031381 [Phalaenopsis equestris]|uniref:uncharacterized protein LOC110031381 n=1 Tax=Phalaenopsis equestris TaxID=78828 RepID=UPI0009E29555|nr:uncharacterized protein LOC110031381 [Phalaenopsis equestris]
MYMKRGRSSQDIEMGSPNSSIVEDSDGSFCLSDAEDEPWHSSSRSNFYEQQSSCVSSHHLSGASELCRHSSISDSSMEVDLESLISEVEENVQKSETDCRICHLSLEIYSQDSGGPMVLGCSCKHDLASAHKQCAETWFKLKGNRTCEICGLTAKNVAGISEADQSVEHPNETSSGSAYAAPPPLPPPQAETTRLFWQGHNILNFLLACMVFAFVISWFFHFNLPD